MDRTKRAVVIVLASVTLCFASGSAPPNDGSKNDSTVPPDATGAATNQGVSAAEIIDLQEKASGGDRSAAYALGRCYETGEGTHKNLEQAAFWYRKAAEQGDPKAQNSLGVLYWLGEGVEKDKQEAVHWYRRAARQGDARAMFNLGAAYYNGEGVPLNDETALAWFLLSSDGGDAGGQDAAKRSQTEHPYMFGDACVRIALMYESGDDLPKDFQKSIDWYKKAEKQGSRQALVGLARLYLSVSNFAEARSWCERAAKQKIPAGFYCLGYLSQKGLAVPQNTAGALHWYQQSAQFSHAPSMRALAQMYEKGEGTKTDRAEAFAWYLRAARRGNQDSLLDARRLRSSMDANEWKSAQKKLSRDFDKGTIDAILQGVTSAETK